MKKMTFDEVAMRWLVDKKLYVKKSTYAAYSLLLTNHLLPYFGHETDVTETKVQKFVISKLEGGLSQKSVKDILVVMKMVLRYGVKNGWLRHREIAVKFPTERARKEVQVLSVSSQKHIMRYLRENLNPMNLGIYICLNCGLRIGEICALRWEDIDLNGGVVHVSKTLQRIYIPNGPHSHTELVIDTAKTMNSIRVIPLTKDLHELLKHNWKIKDMRNFVLTDSPTPTEPRTYRNYYNRLMQQLKMPKLKFHGLRHSFATRCIESKCDYKTVSDLLGHSNISTTLNLYVHPNLEQKQKCIEQMFEMLCK